MKKELLNKEYLTEQYSVKKKTKAYLARELETTVHTLTKYLRKFGISNNPSQFYKAEDLSKNKYDKLQPLYIDGVDKHQKTMWMCECDCGNKKRVSAASLKRRLSKSCGCWKSELVHKGYKDISASYFRRLKEQADKRNIPFMLTPEEVWEIYEKQKGKCALSGVDIFFSSDNNKAQENTASIDRKDSNGSYSKENVQIVHKLINRMKSNLSDEEFIIACSFVSNFNKVNYEDCKDRSFRTTLSNARPRNQK